MSIGITILEYMVRLTIGQQLNIECSHKIVQFSVDNPFHPRFVYLFVFEMAMIVATYKVLLLMFMIEHITFIGQLRLLCNDCISESSFIFCFLIR